MTASSPQLLPVPYFLLPSPSLTLASILCMEQDILHRTSRPVP